MSSPASHKGQTLGKAADGLTGRDMKIQDAQKWYILLDMGIDSQKYDTWHSVDQGTNRDNPHRMHITNKENGLVPTGGTSAEF